MDNNDRLTRLRYALNIKDNDVVEIFRLGGAIVTKDEVRALMLRDEAGVYTEELSDEKFERFLNGLITSQRGVREDAPEPALELHHENANNLLLKKVKIALSLTSEDMLEIMDSVEARISKSELGAVLRKEGHRNYKPCGDRYVRNFLKGLAVKYRG